MPELTVAIAEGIHRTTLAAQLLRASSAASRSAHRASCAPWRGVGQTECSSICLNVRAKNMSPILTIRSTFLSGPALTMPRRFS